MEMAGRGLKGQFKQANRIGARYTVLVEGARGALKDMESGEQTQGLSADSVIDQLLADGN
jgi:histidyl-tRNA synthetase